MRSVGGRPRTLHAMRSHAAKKHGVRIWQRLYVDGSACPVCLKQFWTRPRLLAHYRKSAATCAQLLPSYRPRMDLDDSRRLDKEDEALRKSFMKKGRALTWAELPCVRVSGPLRREAALCVDSTRGGMRSVQRVQHAAVASLLSDGPAPYPVLDAPVDEMAVPNV